jgi:hypothetical protein
MYQKSYRQDLADLVTLQMAYHMPTDVFWQGRTAIRSLEKISYLGGNLFQLLNAIFSQVGEAQTNNFFYSLDCSRLGYDNELYLTGVSANAGTGRVNGVLYTFYSLRNFYHSRTAKSQKSKIQSTTN